MAEKRVPVLDPDGRFGFVNESSVDKLPAGARVLTKKQLEEREAEQARAEAQVREDERYEKSGTAGKVLGGVSTAASLLNFNPITFGAGAAPGSTPAAYNSGVVEGLTGGLAPGLTRQGIDAAVGKEAGDRYAQSVVDQRTASPIAHGAGNLVGTAAGIVAPIGSGAESLAAKGLARAGVNATSALGRAGVAAVELGARGAAEGAAIGGGEYVGNALLQDHDVATDKLFASMGTGALYGGATGAVLGGGLSLAGSGLGRMLGRSATEDAGIAVRQAEEQAPLIGEHATVDRAVEARKALDAMNAAPTAATSSTAAKKIANDLAADALGATKVQMRNALEHVAADQASAKAAVGEYVNRAVKEHVGENASAWAVGKVGRADDILEIIQADIGGRIGAGLSEAVKGTPARVNMAQVFGRAGQEVENMLRDPIRAAGAEPFWNRVSREMEALKLSGKVAPDGTIDAADAFYLRSGLAKNAYEVSKVSGHAGDAYKAFLRDFDTETIKAIDEAGAAAGKSGVGDQIRYWKREWQLARAAEKMAQGGAERYAGNNAFGLREGIAGATAMMTGHPILGVVGPVVMKLAKERGKMVLASQLYQGAERNMLARLVSKTDDQITRASKGLLTAPEKGAAKASEVMPPPRGLVTKALARVAAFEANPDDYVDHAAQQVESIATHSPEIANGLVARQVQAMTFLRGKVPQQGDPDPLDPHPRVRMTPTEEATFARYAWYTEKPERFFAEVARGKLTPEGAEVAHALMPRAFEQLQTQTADALTTQLARGNKLPFRQRELLGQLLDFAATPAQRPEHRAFLQQNVSDVLPSKEPLSGAPASKRRATTTPSGSSALDRLEARGPGRR